jgi:tRNA-Thr(GGU) m(6)t(6)A37 methyltransferase TsaA
MEEILYRPIGVIHTPYKGTEGVPHQPGGGKDVEGTIEMRPEYIAGLKDIEGFSHIILVYHFHLSVGYSLHVKPFMHDKFRGLFATRSPKRPNPIGISIVGLVRVEGGTIYFRNVDIVDGTPLLDIKPYIPEDRQRVERIGWLSERAHMHRRAIGANSR